MSLIEYVESFTSYLLPFIAMVLILVVTHELGHFLAARALSISVAEFAVGFGPLLWSRADRQGCLWAFRLVPLGGFVRFRGDENGASARFLEPETLTPAERNGAYLLRPPTHRALVLIAGPVANIVTAYLVLIGLYCFYGRQYTPAVVAGVTQGSPAMAAGLRVGDKVVAIDGVAVERFEDVQRTVSGQPGHLLSFTVRRDGTDRTIGIKPDKVTIANDFGLNIEVGRIGIDRPSAPERVSVTSAILLGSKDVWFFTCSTVASVGEMIIGARPMSQMGGPIRIMQVSAYSAKHGAGSLGFLLAMLSISVAVFNLLPVPILDGGQIVICAIEAAIRRRPTERVMDASYKIGVTAVVALVLFISYNDVTSLYQQVMRTPASPNTTAVLGGSK